APGEPWRTFASLSLEAVHPLRPPAPVSYDPYAHSLAGLHPTGRLRRLRDAAYAGSRHGRTIGEPHETGNARAQWDAHHCTSGRARIRETLQKKNT
ncbi:hypothetical protein LV779_29625, partial [Streptomyces thinghirensis]|nr:hypothetical protein [Streptomyces thinghirensis]